MSFLLAGALVLAFDLGLEADDSAVELSGDALRKADDDGTGTLSILNPILLAMHPTL